LTAYWLPTMRWPSAQSEISLKTEIVTAANYQRFDVAPEKLTCPTWTEAVGQ
jgi:ribose transport system substrate-binding protein